MATYTTFAINLAVAIAAWAIARRTQVTPSESPGALIAEHAAGSPLIYASIALSGVTALSAQVLWTRVLSLTFGATVYTFSLILAAFLSGLGVGNILGSIMTRRTVPHPRIALGWCQVLLCVAIAWAAYLLTEAIPYWPIVEAVKSNPWLIFRQDLFRSLVVVLPGAVLWGASFPLALASVTATGEDSARLVGGCMLPIPSVQLWVRSEPVCWWLSRWVPGTRNNFLFLSQPFPVPSHWTRARDWNRERRTDPTEGGAGSIRIHRSVGCDMQSGRESD